MTRSPSEGTPTRIAYWCMACPEVFYNAESSNAHHDATGHNQTWRPSNSFAARQNPPAASVEGTTPPTLRELAEAVQARTPGPWRTASNRPFGPWVDRDTVPLATDGMPVLLRNWKEVCLNAAYIAAANPAAILALYAERDAILAAKQYQDEDQKKLGAWVQSNIQHHAGLSWSEGIAREFESLRSALREAQEDTKRLDWLESDSERLEEVFGATVRNEQNGVVRSIIDAAAGSATP